MKKKKIRIAVDFDGTLVEHNYPEIGNDVPGAFKWLNLFKEAGAILILWTMRSDGQSQGPMLSLAVEHCRKHGIEFDGVNEGPDDRSWTSSPKVYAHVYIDDAAAGCPLIAPLNGGRPYVNWDAIGEDILKKISNL